MFSSSLWAGATTERSRGLAVCRGTSAIGATIGAPADIGPEPDARIGRCTFKNSDRPHGPDTVPVTFILEDPESVAGTSQKEHQHKAGVGESLLELALEHGINIEHACGGVRGVLDVPRVHREGQREPCRVHRGGGGPR